MHNVCHLTINNNKKKKEKFLGGGGKPEDYRTDERRNYGGSLRLDLTGRECREALQGLQGI